MKKYAVVGTGGRSAMYLNALAGDFKNAGKLVALCDINSKRLEYRNRKLVEDYGIEPLPCYKADEFDRMILETKPDCVIITSIDRTHHKYICRAMELGCDAVSEKPMTTDAQKCREIVNTIERTGKKLTVTFNYRYTPRMTKVKSLIKEGAIGEITSVSLDWMLDTLHGADYFRRWHRNKNNSGGLQIHKASHHFDLINWCIDSFPKTVFAMGDLKFYGRENAEKRGVKEFYSRARNNPVAAKDPFALHIKPTDRELMGLYYDSESEDGYYRDQSVFGDGISIEDNLAVIVRYENNAVLNYSLNAHSPWEGFRIAFNGTKGRLEVNEIHSNFCNPETGEDFNEFGKERKDGDARNLRELPGIILQRHWEHAQEIKPDQEGIGAHGGGDILLLEHLFHGAGDDPLGLVADYMDGAAAILVGAAANISMGSGLPVNIKDIF